MGQKEMAVHTSRLPHGYMVYAQGEGTSLVEHVAGVEDCHVALASYRAAVERWLATSHRLVAIEVLSNAGCEQSH
jgi:hypothetical protein